MLFLVGQVQARKRTKFSYYLNLHQKYYITDLKSTFLNQYLNPDQWSTIGTGRVAS